VLATTYLIEQKFLGHALDPVVTVVIPAYNAERYIQRTLDSVSAQTYRNLDIVVIDDGSNDRTTEFVEARRGNETRLRLITQSNSGVAAARNAGIDAARGDLIATLDADDLWHPRKIEMQVQRLLADPTAGLVYCWSSWIDVADKLCWQPASPPTFSGHVLAAAVFQNFIGNGSTPLMRRSCIEQVGGYDEELRKRGAEGCEDYKLYTQIASHSRLALVPSFLVGYRVHPDSMSRDGRRLLRSHRVVLADLRRQWPTIPAKIFRWSRAGVAAHLALRAAVCGNYATAVQMWGWAICHDPERLFTTYRKIASRLQSLWNGNDHPATKYPFLRYR